VRLRGDMQFTVVADEPLSPVDLATGARPNSYDWAMMTHVASGLLPADAEFYRILARRRAERQRAAAWQRAYRARQKNAG